MHCGGHRAGVALASAGATYRCRASVEAAGDVDGVVVGQIEGRPCELESRGQARSRSCACGSNLGGDRRKTAVNLVGRLLELWRAGDNYSLP
jgi:hypothetical protein